MKYDRLERGQERGALGYDLYRYGKSKTRYRGPAPDFGKPYLVFLGSSETYGKFLPEPYPRLLGDALGIGCANFAALNAGVDMYLRDPSVLLACGDARVTVISVTGAHNLSNRFYSVHPRRNDRFVRPSDMLQAMYPEVEFTDIHYTRHLLSTLQKADAQKFSLVVGELKTAWTARMKTLLEMVEGKTVLFWMADHPPQDFLSGDMAHGFGPDPLFVDQTMLDHLSPLVTKVAECIQPPDPGGASTEGMVFAEVERAAATALPGPAIHEKAAEILGPILAAMM